MIFIDFEASAPTGYPIEVGVCHVNADRSLTSAAKLIRHDEWLDEFQRWDWQAEQIHNITRANLMEHGENPTAVMGWLNDQLRGQVACADSSYDLIWCQELAAAAGIAMEFAIMDISAAFEGQEIDEAKYDRLARMVSSPVAYGREFGHQFGQSAALGLVEVKTHRGEQDARHLSSWYVAMVGPRRWRAMARICPVVDRMPPCVMWWP
jgi:hypothetical protein